MKSSIAYESARATQKFAPRPKSKPHIMDDEACREVHLRIVDPLAEIRETLLYALNAASRSTYEESGRNRKQARQLVLRAWQELAAVARELAAPVPKFRPDVGHYRPLVNPRYRGVEAAGVEVIRPVSLPARVMGVSR